MAGRLVSHESKFHPNPYTQETQCNCLNLYIPFSYSVESYPNALKLNRFKHSAEKQISNGTRYLGEPSRASAQERGQLHQKCGEVVREKQAMARFQTWRKIQSACMIPVWQLGGLTEGYCVQRAHSELTRYRTTSAQNKSPGTRRAISTASRHGTSLSAMPPRHIHMVAC